MRLEDGLDSAATPGPGTESASQDCETDFRQLLASPKEALQIQTETDRPIIADHVLPVKGMVATEHRRGFRLSLESILNL